jgi:N-methylhydantoinase B/oxoprolinase/acetone carboxylase alpha subunit
MRGSWGARPHADGLDVTALACSTGSSVPAEIVELEHPVRLEYCSYVNDTCGSGRYRGGMAVMREYRLLADEASLQYRSERRKFRPYGLQGGSPGTASIVVWNPDGDAKLLPEKSDFRMRNGDVIRFCQASGGGYGDPLTRDVAQVCRDVRDEIVSLEAARATYGVIIDEETGEVDMTATTELRRSLYKPEPNMHEIEVVPVTEHDIKFMINASNKAAAARDGRP